MATVEERVVSLIAESLSVDPDEVGPEANLKDLGADSLDIVELIQQLEEEFNISIPDRDLQEVATIWEIIDYVKKHTPQN